MTKPNITPELKAAVRTAIAAKAYADTIRPQIESIKQAALDKGQYKYDQKYFDRREDCPTVMTAIKDYWMLSDKDAGQYYTECHAGYLAAGYKVDFGYCPLLIAESTERDALRAMVKASAYIAEAQGLDIERMYYKMEWLHKYEQAIISLVLALSPDKDYFNLDNFMRSAA